MRYMDKIGVGEVSSEAECWEHTGKAPVTVKWVRSSKGDEVRARLVARDFKIKGDDRGGGLFAGMPPLEAKKMIFRMAAKDPVVVKGGRMQRRKLWFVDVKKAHLNGRV